MADENSDIERDQDTARITNAVGDDDQAVLLTEYEQAGAEARTRERLIHNGYYIFITVTALLLWRGLQLLSNNDSMGIGLLLIGGGALYVLLGLVIVEHYRKRRSAWDVRGRVERLFADDDWFVSGEKEELVRHPLSSQHHIVGTGIVWDVDGEESSRDPDYRFKEAPGLSGELKPSSWCCDFSARGLARFIVLFGLLDLVIGIIVFMNLFSLC